MLNLIYSLIRWDDGSLHVYIDIFKSKKYYEALNILLRQNSKCCFSRIRFHYTCAKLHLNVLESFINTAIKNSPYITGL